MNDNMEPGMPIGAQIRRLRKRRGWTLAELARRAGTSGPTLHRYESGWDRFELETLRRIAAALGARLDVRLIAGSAPAERSRRPSARALVEQIAPLFWDHKLTVRDLSMHSGWVVERVLTAGSLSQVRAVRVYLGDAAIRSTLKRRGVDPRTRAFWSLLLGSPPHAPQGS